MAYGGAAGVIVHRLFAKTLKAVICFGDPLHASRADMRSPVSEMLAPRSGFITTSQCFDKGVRSGSKCMWLASAPGEARTVWK